MIHEMKILQQYYKDVKNGTKTFELRKDDRNVQAGDIILLKEWTGTRYTGNELEVIVTYVLRNCREYGLAEGYCIIGIARIINKETCEMMNMERITDKLSLYEDLEEKGQLIKLPCNVGDTVYAIHVISGKKIIAEVKNVDLFFLLLSVAEGRIGKTVFLTRKEAEETFKQ